MSPDRPDVSDLVRSLLPLYYNCPALQDRLVVQDSGPLVEPCATIAFPRRADVAQEMDSIVVRHTC
jgi:hypothetical protein